MPGSALSQDNDLPAHCRPLLATITEMPSISPLCSSIFQTFAAQKLPDLEEGSRSRHGFCVSFDQNGFLFHWFLAISTCSHAILFFSSWKLHRVPQNWIYIYWIKIKRKRARTQYSVHKQRIHLLNDLYFVLHLLVSI